MGGFDAGTAPRVKLRPDLARQGWIERMKLQQILDLGSGRTSRLDEGEPGQEDGRLLRCAARRGTKQGHRAGYIDSPIVSCGKLDQCPDPETAVCLLTPGPQLPGAGPTLIACGDQAVRPEPVDQNVITAVPSLCCMRRLRREVPKPEQAVAPGDGDVDLAGAGATAAYDKAGPVSVRGGQGESR